MANFLPFILDIFIYFGIYGILCMSFSIEYGFTGMPNFGVVAYFMIGAYATAILTLSGIPFYGGFFVGTALAAAVGFLVTRPALRLKPDYLSIVTLAFGEILRYVFKNESWIAGGTIGLKGVPSAFSFLIGASYDTILSANFLLVYAIMIICFLLARTITNSPYGRVIRGIREDELATQSLGKNTLRYKSQVFAIGSGMAGAAGGFFTQYIGYVGYTLFAPEVTFRVLLMSVLGGPANIVGAFLGASVLQGIERGLRILKDYLPLQIDPNNLMFILIGILIVIIMLYRPEGILKEKRIKTINSGRNRE